MASWNKILAYLPTFSTVSSVHAIDFQDQDQGSYVSYINPLPMSTRQLNEEDCPGCNLIYRHPSI
jgi:hypothetical protein